MTLALKVAAALAIAWLAVALAAYLGQRRLMYFPDPERTPPSDVGLTEVEEITLSTSDGVQLIAWWARARQGQPTLLYFHGNAGSAAFRSERIKRYQALGRGILMLNYRGYGGSTGRPSEANNVADALLTYDWLTRQGIAANDIILYGESLGSGVAVQVSTQRPVGGVILDSPYTSAVEVGAAAYPYLPVRWLMLDRYDSLSRIGRLGAPLLIVHGERDRIIPIEMGRRLFAAAAEPKEIVTFPLAGHSDHYLHGSYEAINAWIDRLRRDRGAAAQ